MCEENIYGVITLLSVIKKLRPNTKVFVWSGYKFEELEMMYRPVIFKDIDVLIDGKFEEDKADMRLKLRGSSNQRVIDVKESLKHGKIIEIEK